MSESPPRLPPRTPLDLQVDLAWHQWRFAMTPQSAALWQARYEELCRARAAQKAP